MLNTNVANFALPFSRLLDILISHLTGVSSSSACKRSNATASAV
nr:MAG TPA: hypothetical protein [Caudoviricetes sp.]